MKKILEKTQSIFYIIFFITFLLLFINVLFFNHTSFANISFIKLLLSVVIYIFISLFLYYILMKKIRTKKLFTIILFLIFIILQFIFSYVFMVHPTWDFGIIYNSVIDDVTDGVNIFKNKYYYMYSNNLAMALLIKTLFNIFKIIGLKVKYYILGGIIFNITMIDVAILYLYKTLKLCLDENKSYFFLICSLLITPFITYAPIFYTDTISMPFVIIALYYFLSYMFSDKKKISYLAICGLSIGIGSCVKFSVIIILVAIIIYLLFQNITIKEKIKILFIISIISVIPLLSLNVIKKNNMNQKMLNELEYPVTHWVMMGLHENEYGRNGTYYEPDVNYTASFNSVDEKKTANIKVIKQRLTDYKENKNLYNFYRKKAVFIWGDGSFYAPLKLALKPYNNYQVKKLILGNEKESLVFRCVVQSQLFLIFIFMILGVSYRKYLNEKQKNILFINSITIFGVFLFFMLWEARSRYLVNYIPLLLIQTYLGVIAIEEKVRSKKKK